MNKYLALLLASCNGQVYADQIIDFTKLYPPPQVIYVVPVQQYAPPVYVPPTTYVAPSNTWTPMVTSTPTIDLRANK